MRTIFASLFGSAIGSLVVVVVWSKYQDQIMNWVNLKISKYEDKKNARNHSVGNS